MEQDELEVNQAVVAVVVVVAVAVVAVADVVDNEDVIKYKEEKNSGCCSCWFYCCMHGTENSGSEKKFLWLML